MIDNDTMTHKWFPWYSRTWFRLPVAICTHSDWAGSSFKLARNDRGRILYFWTRKAAQAYADRLNQEPQA